ncbi:hypothetical protein BC937DRAFT_89542 [Endogone sp. FLAS-F59071]|nr:hypothetical protein BC937DRAFT_89542 [Endogone sp. FLAS-F59071]|eukprot:RUS17751.1 hypothetical protein BC937DRAFT_89542 [Endogone sp. FLAS-F59071]
MRLAEVFAMARGKEGKEEGKEEGLWLSVRPPALRHVTKDFPVNRRPLTSLPCSFPLLLRFLSFKSHHAQAYLEKRRRPRRFPKGRGRESREEREGRHTHHGPHHSPHPADLGRVERVCLQFVLPCLNSAESRFRGKPKIPNTYLLCLMHSYRKLHNTYEFLVDQQIDTKLQINIDLTVAMQCGFLSVDVIDIAGERQHLQNLHTISERAKYYIRYRTLAENQGACRVIGSIEVNKVAGNLHITSLGHGYPINFTHRIDEFSFGQLYPSLINPLDESFEISNSHFEQFQYFMSVPSSFIPVSFVLSSHHSSSYSFPSFSAIQVPTIYIDRSNNQLLTNQYSVNDYRRAFNAEQPGFVPGNARTLPFHFSYVLH